jgi:hypothetical protein
MGVSGCLLRFKPYKPEEFLQFFSLQSPRG